METTISREQLLPVLVLYHGDRAVHRTRLRVLVFLADKAQPNGEFYSYEKYDYGPRSGVLMQDLRSLEKSGVVETVSERTGGGKERVKYELSEFGVSAVSELLDEDDAVFELSIVVSETVESLYNMNIRELLETELYERFPKFRDSSVYKR